LHDECTKKVSKWESDKAKKKEKDEEIKHIIDTNQKLTSFFTTKSSDSLSVTSKKKNEQNIESIENNKDKLKITTDIVSNTINSNVNDTILCENQIINLNDPVEWKSDNYHQDYIARNGYVQNIDCDFSLSSRMYGNVNRFCSKKFFIKNLKIKKLYTVSGWFILQKLVVYFVHHVDCLGAIRNSVLTKD